MDKSILKPKIITLRKLKAKRACQVQLDKFKELFGSKVEITLELCIKHAQDFNFNWAADDLLSASALAEYQRVRAPAWAEYQRVRAPAWAEYQRVTASAYAEYDRVKAPAYAEYDRVTASALAEYNRVTAPALAEYQRVRASAFFHAWEQDNG